jgi:mono/diheme cytochrome c family protein
MALAAACLAAATSAAERPPAEQYLLHCSGCHGRDGGGAPPTTPSLRDLAAVLAAPGGRAYLARVPGVAQAPISDAELAQLLEWVLREFSQATVDPPFSPEEIGRLRSAPLRDPVAARPAPRAQRKERRQ